jgi:hypothetical protein
VAWKVSSNVWNQITRKFDADKSPFKYAGIAIELAVEVKYATN